MADKNIDNESKETPKKKLIAETKTPSPAKARAAEAASSPKKKSSAQKEANNEVDNKTPETADAPKKDNKKMEEKPASQPLGKIEPKTIEVKASSPESPSAGIDIIPVDNPKYLNNMDQALDYLTGNVTAFHHDNGAIEAASRPIRHGLLFFVIVFVFIGGWSVLAPLNSAAIAVGKVTVDSSKKSIEHLEGGIVAEFLVRDGDVVEAGQPLLRLDDTTARSSWEIYQSQMRSALATEARLIAERDQKNIVTFNSEIWTYGNRDTIRTIIDGERQLFEYRKRSLEGEKGVLEQRIKQFDDEIEALRAQEVSAEKQLALIQEEVETVETLVEQGRAVKPRLLALKRNAAELEGQLGEYKALIARAGQSIAENKLAIINLDNELLGNVVNDLKQTQDDISDIRERIAATRDTLDRVVIHSPVSGVVTGREYSTVGGVIPPGKPIMYVVPGDDEKIIEARVLPQDIDSVYEGLHANVRLTAFKMRTVPVVKGSVSYVSADRFDDPQLGTSYYKTRVKLDKDFLASITEDLELRPGMPAEVHIVTGKKTLMGYLLDPLTAYFDRAFREE